jgi:putative addiction module component (TIGR02574 family)
MTKNQMTDLHKLSVKDKIKIVQALWDDIAKEQSIEALSMEHKRILDERIQIIETGNAQYKSWAEVKAKYHKLHEV